MDIIQKTVALFGNILNKIKSIGNILKSEILPSEGGQSNTGGFFWIFGW